MSDARLLCECVFVVVLMVVVFAQVLYLAADVVPGQKPRSSTLRNAEQEKLQVYENMVTSITVGVQALGVRVMTFDDLGYGKLQESDKKKYYFKHGIVDQIICSRAALHMTTGNTTQEALWASEVLCHTLCASIRLTGALV